MRHVIELVFQYRVLRGKVDDLAIGLEEDERAALAGLERLLRGDDKAEATARREFPRLPWPASVSYTVPGGFGVGKLRDVSGGGLSIWTTQLVPEGVRTVVRINDEQTGAEYVFPCRIVWSKSGSRPVMGLEFEGVPTRSPFVTGPRSIWRRNVRWVLGPMRPVAVG